MAIWEDYKGNDAVPMKAALDLPEKKEGFLAEPLMAFARGVGGDVGVTAAG
jgi:hypothetical protein